MTIKPITGIHIQKFVSNVVELSENFYFYRHEFHFSFSNDINNSNNNDNDLKQNHLTTQWNEMTVK